MSMWIELIVVSFHDSVFLESLKCTKKFLVIIANIRIWSIGGMLDRESTIQIVCGKYSIYK